MTSEGIRAWFVRDVLDSVERRDDRTLARLGDRLPERLARWLEPALMRNNQPADLLPLDEGEELLLAIDATVGDGSGRVLEQVAFELATRMLMQTGSAVIVGDLQATMARIRPTLERPYTGVEVGIEFTRTDTGFSISLRVPGRPRAARLLRHVAVGTLRGAHRFCREAPEDALKVFAETIGDRAHIVVRLRAAPEATPEAEAPASIPPAALRRPSRNMRAVSPLSEEIERIMGGQAIRPSVPPAPRRTASNPRIDATRTPLPSVAPPQSVRPRRPGRSETEEPAPSAPTAAQAPQNPVVPPSEAEPNNRGKR